jgi:hypothetical protein
MDTMNIMKMKWKINPSESRQIITDEPDGNYWNVFMANTTLSGDHSGRQAAADLVAEHNAHLELEAELTITKKQVAVLLRLASKRPCTCCPARTACDIMAAPCSDVLAAWSRAEAEKGG